MYVQKCNHVTYFDVDETLIIWNPTHEQIVEHGILHEAVNGEEIHFVPHKRHVAQLKKHKQRGHTIVVWSAGGHIWAEKAVRILDLVDYVDLVIAKPLWFYDDKNAEEFMGKPSFYKDE